MMEKFNKYFLIGTLCTIMCKVLLPYSPTTVYKQELSVSISTLDVDSDKDLLVYRVEKENFFNNVLYFLIYENEETDEDEASDEISQKKNCHLTSVTNNNSNFLDARNCAAAIPLFILFHSWKCFLF